MARTPLYPRGHDFTFWAQATTQRQERDFHFLRAKTGSISLSVGVQAHVIGDINMLSSSHVFISPTSTAAKDIVTDSGYYITGKAIGTFTIRTSLSAVADCTFDYVIFPQKED